LEAMLAKEKHNSFVAQTASAATAPILAPQFLIRYAGVTSQEDIVEWKVLKSGEIIFVLENMARRHDIFSVGSAEVLKTLEISRRDMFSISEDEEGDPTLVMIRRIWPTRLEKAWDMVRHKGMNRFKMIETSLRGKPRKETLHYSDTDYTAFWLLPPNPMQGTWLRNSNGESVVMTQDERKLQFFLRKGSEYKPIGAALENLLELRSHMLSAGLLPDGRIVFAASPYNTGETISYHPAFKGDSGIAIGLNSAFERKESMQLFVTPAGRVLVGVASEDMGKRVIEVFAPEEGLKPIFKVEYPDAAGFSLRFFARDRSTYLVAASKDRFLDFYQPEAGENLVLRKRLEPGDRLWDVKPGANGQSYLLIKKDRGSNLDIFSIFNRENG
jgi:hypothetical protein